ncbi:hypothetical protein AB0J21_00760 [Streptomyces sp. NPDC049954]|uniref:hypothetical protein n=1 Tax=Streptomyces sp. NPDC049954 TaxID=3155779 RepID=UPI00342419A2
MRTTPALAAGLAAAALVLAAPVAWSAQAGPAEVVVAPAAVPRGTSLTVAVRGADCAEGTVESPAFSRTRLHRAEDGDTARAGAFVERSVAPGRYDVTVRCGGLRLTRSSAFTVFHGGVRGGTGGSTEQAAGDADMMVGGGLVAAAVIGGGLLWLRGRAEERDRPDA